MSTILKVGVLASNKRVLTLQTQVLIIAAKTMFYIILLLCQMTPSGYCVRKVELSATVGSLPSRVVEFLSNLYLSLLIPFSVRFNTSCQSWPGYLPRATVCDECGWWGISSSRLIVHSVISTAFVTHKESTN